MYQVCQPHGLHPIRKKINPVLSVKPKILFIKGPHCGRQGQGGQLLQTLTPPVRIQKRTKGGNRYYDLTQVPLTHLNLVISNCRKGLIPYYPIQSYYGRGPRDRRVMLLKLIKRRCPFLLTRMGPSPIKGHWVVTHLAQDLGLDQDRIRAHLSASIQHYVEVESKTLDQWNSWKPHPTLAPLRV